MPDIELQWFQILLNFRELIPESQFFSSPAYGFLWPQERFFFSWPGSWKINRLFQLQGKLSINYTRYHGKLHAWIWNFRLNLNVKTSMLDNFVWIETSAWIETFAWIETYAQIETLNVDLRLSREFKCYNCKVKWLRLNWNVKFFLVDWNVRTAMLDTFAWIENCEYYH